MAIGVDLTDANTSATSTSNTWNEGTNDTTTSNVVNATTGSNTQGSNSSTNTGTSNTATTGNTGTTTAGTSNTTNSQNTATTGETSASASSIADVSSLLSTAVTNANNAGAITDPVVKNILNQAAMTYGSQVGGASNGAGIYNSATQGLLKGYSEAQAVAQAAPAVLNYGVQEQTLAQQAGQSLIGAQTFSSGTAQLTGSSSTGTTGTSNTNTSGTSNTGTSSIANSVSSLVSNVVNALSASGNSNNTTTNIGQAVQNSNSSSQGASGGVSLSVICTELRLQKKITRSEWQASMRHYGYMPEHSKVAYHAWADHAVKHLKAHPGSLLSKALEVIFRYRARGYRAPRYLVATFTTIIGLCYAPSRNLFFSYLVNRYIKRNTVEDYNA